MVERFRTRDPLKGMLRRGVNESFALVCLPELLPRVDLTRELVAHYKLFV